MHIDITADTSHSSTPSLHIAHLINSLGTLSNAFPDPQIQNKLFTLTFYYFYCIYLTTNIIPLPFIKPNSRSLYLRLPNNQYLAGIHQQ